MAEARHTAPASPARAGAARSAPWPPSRVREVLRRVLRRRATREEVIELLAAGSGERLDAEFGFAFVDELRTLTPPRPCGGTAAVNIVGTGQGLATFNISTAAAIVASAMGVPVLKSGSAAHGSRCGAIDVLQALSIARPRDEKGVQRMLSELGIAFLAENHYSVIVLGLAALLRPLTFRDVGRFMNTIGPLLCPYRVSAQLSGVSHAADLDVLATIAERLSGPELLFVHAEVGMDEFCSVSRHRFRVVSSRRAALEQGLAAPAPRHGELEALRGGEPAANARRLRDVIAGRSPGVAEDTVALNAGALAFLAGRASSLGHGAELAARAIRDGAAERQLQRIISWSEQGAKRP